MTPVAVPTLEALSLEETALAKKPVEVEEEEEGDEEEGDEPGVNGDAKKKKKKKKCGYLSIRNGKDGGADTLSQEEEVWRCDAV